MKKLNLKLCLWIFYINLFISIFTFGGGYVVVPMIRKYYVFQKRLFSEDELMDMAAVSQSTPGSIAINLSSMAGYQSAGIPGLISSIIATLLPPIIILSLISHWYTAFAANTVIAALLKGMQAGVSAIIVDVVVDMTQLILKERSILLTLMVPVVFIASFTFNINVILILVICCAVCILRTIWSKRRKK